MVDDMKLLPCPFCGNDGNGPVEEALHISHTENDWRENRDSYSVQCDKCTATMGYSDSEDEAIAAWNTRAAPPAMDREAVEFVARVLWADAQRRLGSVQTDLPRTRTDFRDIAAKLFDHPALSTLSADAIRQGEGFSWPEPKFVPIESGAKLNPERVEAAFQLINGEMVIGEQFQLIEMMLDGTDYTIVPATPASHASDGGKA